MNASIEDLEYLLFLGYISITKESDLNFIVKSFCLLCIK